MEKESFCQKIFHKVLFCTVVLHTVWKFQAFSIIHTLRVINFGESRSFKTADFTTLGALKFVKMVNFSLQKCKKPLNIKIQSL